MAAPCLKPGEAFPISKRGDNEYMSGRSTIDKTYGFHVRRTHDKRRLGGYLYLFRLRKPTWEFYRAPRQGSKRRESEDRGCGTLQFLPESLLPISAYPM
jgi:hypothetical protein